MFENNMIVGGFQRGGMVEIDLKLSWATLALGRNSLQTHIFSRTTQIAQKRLGKT